jgi:exosortase/archaeosortase family protein
MLPAWAFLWVAVRPPMGLDTDLIFALQSVATWWSSCVLDLLGVFHVAAGHVIEVVDRRLLVEEACSGIYSLFVGLTATLFYVLWVRRGWLSSLLLFAAATAWVMVGNVVRIVTTAGLWSRWGVDFNSGWKHELFGLLILVLTVGLILSTDRLLQTVLGGVRRVWSERFARWFRQSWDILRFRFARGGAGSVDERTSPRMGGGGPGARAARGEADGPGEPTRWPPARKVWLASWPAMAVFGLLGLWQLTVAARGALHAAPALGWNLAPTLERTFASLKADDLPDRVGPYRREGFAVERNAVPGIMAEHARVWIYRSPRATATVSASYPFEGWHEVTECYSGQGWIIGEREVEAGEAEGAGPRVAAGMEKPLDRIGLLVFALGDERSEPLSPPPRGRRAVLRERWSSGLARLLVGQPSGASGAGSGPSYQVQVLWESEEPPTPADQVQVRELFERARAACRRHNPGIARSGGPIRERRGLPSPTDTSP